MKHVSELLPVEVHGLPRAPWEGFFAFNPSITREPDGTYLCTLRCADYSMLGGFARYATPGRVITRNVLLELDPGTWQPRRQIEMRELDGQPRVSSVNIYGFEDMRLFHTKADGLLGIATTIMFTDNGRSEMVLCRFDRQFNIVQAIPLRGTFWGSWSDVPQKNWTPYDGADEIRFLYSIERGVVFGAEGPIGGDGWIGEHVAPAAPAPAQPRQPPVISYDACVETRLEPTSFAAAETALGPQPARRVYDWSAPGLRGGSQLVPLGDGRWLAIAHGVQRSDRTAGHMTSNYWHVWYTADETGRVLERSVPMKLSRKGIELAMGLAIDPARDLAVVSYGTEDAEAWLGVTRLSAVLELVRPQVATEGREAIA